MSTIASPRRSGSIRGIEGGVERLLASFKKKSEKQHSQRPFVPHRDRAATAPASARRPRNQYQQRERVAAVHPAERNGGPVRAESMATLATTNNSATALCSSTTIASSRRSGSIRGVEGSVGKLLASFEKKTENYDHSPLMKRIKSVSQAVCT